MTFAQLQSTKKILLQSFLISLFLFAFSLNANAQVYGQALDVTFTPKNPGPRERVTVTVKDVVGNLDQKEITWTLDGQVYKRGVGEKKIDFELGPLGSVSSVRVTTDVLSKTIQIRPTEVDIIWESDGYTPPFYKGKAMRVYQGGLRLVAIPNFVNSQGGVVDRERLVYNWRNSGVLNAPNSGYGKSLVTYPGSIISRPLTITVEVSSSDGVYKGGKEVTVESVEPLLSLYEDHPLYGVLYNKALNNTVFKLENREVKITAVPFYFSTKSKTDEKLNYTWVVNGFPAITREFKDFVVLRQEGGTQGQQLSGQSNITLQLDNQKEFMQTQLANLRVEF